MHWKFEKMNPISGLKRIFSVKGLVELAKALMKVFLIGTVAFFVLRSYLPDIIYLNTSNLFSSVNRLVSFFPELVIFLLLPLALIGAIDLAWQKYDYIKSLRMSHQDVKDEHKETEGQPEVKAKSENFKCKQHQKLKKKHLQ